jgi:hypothetical protein
LREEITLKAAGSRETIDDETVAYILLAQKYFEDLRQVAAQLAGLLVLAAAGGKSATPHHPMLDAAKQLHESAAAGIRGLSATPRASTHRNYLSRAAAALECALSSAQTHLSSTGRGVEVEPILHPLQAAYAQLQLAAAALPGFEMISFDQACCGPQIHASTVPAGSHQHVGARAAK